MSFLKFACRIFSRRAFTFSISRDSGEGVLEASRREGEAGAEGVASLEMFKLCFVFSYLSCSDSVTEGPGFAEEVGLEITWLIASFDVAVLGAGGLVMRWE